MNERIVIVLEVLQRRECTKNRLRWLIVLFARTAHVNLVTGVREHNKTLQKKWQQLCAEYSLHAVISHLAGWF